MVVAGTTGRNSFLLAFILTLIFRPLVQNSLIYILILLHSLFLCRSLIPSFILLFIPPSFILYIFSSLYFLIFLHSLHTITTTLNLIHFFPFSPSFLSSSPPSFLHSSFPSSLHSSTPSFLTFLTTLFS